MAKVFISYRRADSATFSGRIYDRLVAKFGRKNIFKDVDDIPAGVDFVEYIQTSLRQCAVELVIIGPQWIESRLPSGALRLDDPNDFVRIEIETALSLGLTVIPILVDNATMPDETRLPEPLRKLHRINALSVRQDPDFARDMERVIAALERAFAARPSRGLLGRRNTPAQAKPPSQAPSESLTATPLPATSPASAPLDPTASTPDEMPRKETAEETAATLEAHPAAPAMPNAREKNPSALTGKRPLVAGLAVLLIVLSLGGLLTNRVISQNQASIAAQTTTAMAQASATGNAVNSATLTAKSLETQISATMTGGVETATAQVNAPYFAAIPGPCGDASGAWENQSQEVFNGHTTFVCLSDGFKITIQAEQTNSSSYFNDAYAHVNYQVSVDVSNLTGDVCASVWAERQHSTVGSGYVFSICRDGTYKIYSIGDGGAIQGRFLRQGTTSSLSTFGMKIRVNGNSLRLTRNEQVLASVSDGTYSSWKGVGVALSIDPRFGFTAGSGIFRNFSFQPI